LQYTIEARPLTRDPEVPSSTTIEARDAGEALSHYVRSSQSEIVSFQSTARRESIATVRKKNAVFLVRVYSA
jgi:hypothetical protein